MLNETERELQHEVDALVMEERREHPRRPCGHCITAVPCDELGNAIGSLVVGHCIDVSDSGIRVSTAQPICTNYVRVELLTPAADVGFQSAVVKVLRSTAEGSVFICAGQFVEGLVH